MELSGESYEADIPMLIDPISDIAIRLYPVRTGAGSGNDTACV